MRASGATKLDQIIARSGGRERFFVNSIALDRVSSTLSQPWLNSEAAMTRRQLRRAIIQVIGVYTIAAGMGLALGVSTSPYYDAFRDIVPFVFGIPAAYLGYCFQQRQSYMESLRMLWTRLVQAVQESIRYTFDPTPTQREYAQALMELAIAVDEVRGVYKNIGERAGQVGVYPYEPIKEIYNAVAELGYGELTAEQREIARQRIKGHWRSIRANFLDEFDRAEPGKIVSPYIEKKPRP